MILFSVGSFSSTARFSATAFHHHSLLLLALCLVGMNTMLLLSFQEWMQNLEAQTKQNQKLQKNLIISIFASSQLTNGISCSFSLQTDVSAKPKTFVNCSEKKNPKQNQKQNQNHHLPHLAGIFH